MKKQLFTLLIISAGMTASAQVKKLAKEYQQPDPKKYYSFTFKADVGTLVDLQNLNGYGLDSLSKSQIPAAGLRQLSIKSSQLFNDFSTQLRQQIVADSLAKVKKVGGK